MKQILNKQIKNEYKAKNKLQFELYSLKKPKETELKYKNL